MTSATTNSRFLGIDFHLLAREFAAGWGELQGSRFFGWFVPSTKVRVLQDAGAERVWRADGSAVTGPSGGGNAAFVALALPEEYLLLRTLSLPPLPDAEVERAVKLDVEGASPFPLADLVWGYSASRRAKAIQVRIAMASRRQVDAYRGATGIRVPAGVLPEVWAVPEGAQPIVLRGFGEARRLARASLRQRAAVGLLLLAVVLGALIAATPVMQLRERALEAVAAYEAVVNRAEPLVRQRTTLLKRVDSVNAVKEVLVQRSDPLYVMDLLTRALPDDTSLLGFQVQGPKVTINGLTINTAALMQQLSSVPELRDVRAPTAATRSPGNAKDVFNIEFMLVERPPFASPVLLSPEAAAAASRESAAVTTATRAAASAGTPTAAPAFGGQPAPTGPAAAPGAVGQLPTGPFPVQPPTGPFPVQPPAAPLPAQALPQGGASLGGASFGAPTPPGSPRVQPR